MTDAGPVLLDSAICYARSSTDSEVTSTLVTRRACVCAAELPRDCDGPFAEALRLHEQFCHFGDLEAAQSCITICEAILDGHAAAVHPISGSSHLSADVPTTFPASQPERHHVLIQLAHTLEKRMLYTFDVSDLQRAMEYGQAALDVCSAEGLACPTVFSQYASILDSNADDIVHREDRRLGESLCRAAILLCPPGHPLRAAACRNLGWILFRNFETTGSGACLEEAITVQRQVLTETLTSTTLDRHLHLRCLGRYLLIRQESFGDPLDLDKSLAYLEEALKLCPPTHIDTWKIIGDMVWVLQRRFFHSGAIEDLNRAADLGRRALDGDCPNGQRLLPNINGMALLLNLLHQVKLSDGKDIDESIELMQEALQRSDPGSADHWIFLMNMGDNLRLRFRWKGDLDDLEEAVHFGRLCADAVPEGHCRQFHPSMNLADMLMLRFSETRNICDLDEALAWDRRAMSIIPSTHSEMTVVVLRLVAHLCTRYETLHEVEDIDEAISLAQESLATLPEGHVNKPPIVYRLAQAYLLRGQDDQSRSAPDINQAIQTLEPNLEATLQGIYGSECLRILATSYLVRFRRLLDVNDAARAMQLTSRSLDLAQPGRRDRYWCLVHAAELYLEHGTQYRNPSLALAYIKDALADDHRDVRSRLQGAMRVLDDIHSHHGDVINIASPAQMQLLDIYAYMVGLLPRVAFFGLHLQTRLQSLKAGQSVALEGASHALNLSLPEKALEILEQGRALFWTHSLRLRSPFDAVPVDLRDRLVPLARQLEQVSDAPQTDEEVPAVEEEESRRRKQSDEFNSLLDQVRQLPGQERFLLPDDYATLAKVAERGPVVVLVSSKLGCHAVVLRRSVPVISLPLGQVSEAWLTESAGAWNLAVSEARSVLGERLKVAKTANRQRARRSRAEEILRMLWTNVVHPIIDVLQIQASSGRNRPRMWWCPTGPFVHLPLHAAGVDGTWCSDYVVSSYTPTLGALLSARATYKPTKKHETRALVAAVPHSDMPDWKDLLSTREEVAAVRAILPDGADISELPGDGAMVPGNECGIKAQSLLEKLPQATILHLACHGHQDPENPLKSGFVMQDEMLTIERLMPVALPNAFVAFLSACETAKGDKDQPDQAVHLAAAMLFAGFKSIIATLWSMEDVDGPAIASSVYRVLLGGDAEEIDPDDIPYALDDAVRELRRDHPNPSRWAPYIHLGI
ncbi:hypothetical protein PUNSTDRAFT_136640 [Punctularia strigosozonata HHB-11173 SS5]|uniref:uncharacterized protein n=1 Tax=Punctularia strigosozonata (strain HHB-11173) TaxID=741275 RepID=UPI000441847D|nr:uncharacterized protein PUNSTDRAFT_136640 [Punctularia strigosozonata HHB-11173 SS5]EIN06809.1 hypothetical protein PUNSTDRAFT_136640 [Punctularia strigosozonata HHB-11173 SS5]